MHTRTRTGNRVGLAATGLILLLAGVALVGAHHGTLVHSAPHQRLYPGAARRFVHDNHDWLWPVAATVAVLVGLVFLRWLLVQARVDRVRTVRIDSDNETADGAGRTRMVGSALTNAIEDDLENVRGVRRVRASLAGPSDDPQLWLHISTYADAELGRLRMHLTDVAIPDARAALDHLPVHTQVRIDVARQAEVATRTIH